MLTSLRTIILSTAFAALAISASAEPFDSTTTEMPGEVFDTDGNGIVVSAEFGGWGDPLSVFWSTDNGTSWVKLNSPPEDGWHHDPREIDLRTDGIISLYVFVGEWGPKSPWNNTPTLHWRGSTIYTVDLGATWSAWGASPPAPTAAKDWQYYE